ncbi:MAG TPA: secretin N-terminal domain-containing protein [Planctomycetota bacterium]|nr:secretin N-terminal domain-containing protein [Planctomycetota bacterium]
MKALKIILAVGALLLAFAPAGFAQGTTGKDARINLSVDKRKLSEVAQFLRDQSRTNIVVATDADMEITLELTDVPWRDALDIAAEQAGCVVEERTGGILMVVRPLPVTIDADDQDIKHVISLIGKSGNANILVAPEVKGTVSVHLKNVPWRDALEVTAKTLGYVVVEENRGILRVVDPDTLQSQMVTKSYQLRYMRPKSQYKPMIKSEFLQPINVQQGGAGAGKDIAQTFTVLKALTKALSKGGELDYIESQNVIIVRDTDQIHEQIRDMVAQLDIEPSQVFCDVKFVSTLNTDLLDLGVDYGDGGPQIGISGGQIPITLPFGLGGSGWEDGIIANTAGTGPFADPALNAGSTIIPDTVFGKLSFTGVAATLKMLQRDTKSEVIQAPKLIALDGHEATIFVGETIRYAEAKSEQGQAGGLQLSLSEAQGSPVDVGFQLLIVPHVIPGTNNMTMDVIPKETSLSGGSGASALSPAGFDVFTVGASGLEGTIALPRTRSSTIVTTMLLASGQTAVIGGLTTEQDSKSTARVPFLSAIPIVGELFKYRKKDRQRRSLLVFVTPTIVHSSGEQEMLLQREFSIRNTALRAQIETLAGSSAAAAPATEGH